MNDTSRAALNLRPGDRIRVKAPDAILNTLDDRGRLDDMPFMPEMFDACGKVFDVFARADKTCDTATRTGGRRLTATVHLAGERCDGSAHGGCQAQCLNFWKEAWLERVGPDAIDAQHTADSLDSAKRSLAPHTTSGRRDDGEAVYSCQATTLPEYTTPLSPWAMGQYWRDVTANGVGLGRLLSVGFKSVYARLVDSGVGYSLWVGLYDRIQKWRGGQPWPHRSGKLSKTPTGELGLEPGDYVRIRSFDEILATLDTDNKNRGLYFDVEMVRYCGQVHRVKSRVTRIINEGTGEMMNFGNPCIILESVWCSSEWSTCRRFCPRAIYHWWREVWLEPVAAPSQVQQQPSEVAQQ